MSLPTEYELAALAGRIEELNSQMRVILVTETEILRLLKCLNALFADVNSALESGRTARTAH